jgi:hypothetical protein
MTSAVYRPPSPRSAPAHGRVGDVRREQLRRTRLAVLAATNTCGRGERAVVTVLPTMTGASIQAVFDEIDEKRHLVGIELHFSRDQDTVKAIFDPAGTEPE